MHTGSKSISSVPYLVWPAAMGASTSPGRIIAETSKTTSLRTDRLSHCGRRMSLFRQTLVLRVILSGEQEHRQDPTTGSSSSTADGQLTQYPQEFAMSKTAITSPELTPPVGPFSQAIEVGGFLYFSGQVAQDPATGKVVEGGILAETERVLQNLEAVLKAAGKSFDDVVRAGVFLTSMSDFAAMNGIYAKYFSQPFPARTTIAVAALALGACVEIDLVVKA